MVFSCPQCHFINHSGDHFCGGCGASFSAPPAPKSFSKESIGTTSYSSPQPGAAAAKKSAAITGQALKDFLNIQKGGGNKKKQGKDEKKQVSQEEIERLINQGLEKGEDS